MAGYAQTSHHSPTGGWLIRHLSPEREWEGEGGATTTTSPNYYMHVEIIILIASGA